MSEATNGITARMIGLERRVDRLEDIEPAVLRERVTNIEKEQALMSDEFRALRRALYTFSIAVSASALGFAFTVLMLLGGRQ